MKKFLTLLIIFIFISPVYAFSASYEKNEEKFHKAVEKRDFKKAGLYLDCLLKKTPENEKLLKLGIDIAIAQSDYQKALLYFNEIHKKTSLTPKDSELLAFLYFQNGNSKKALEVIEKLLKDDPENFDLLFLACNYSAEQKDWDKAIFYNEKLLGENPINETLLKNEADFYVIKEKFKMAINSYEKIVENYPKTEYKLDLFNLYMKMKNFSKAQKIIESLYIENPCNKRIIASYVNTLLLQNKLDDAAWLVIKHRLQNTKEGAIICADNAMQKNDYNCASKYYLRAIKFDKENDNLKLKLAQSYRMAKNFDAANQIYYGILSKDISNKEALLGLGYLKMDGKFYPQARSIFRDILEKDPNYLQAKLGIFSSYANNGESLSALKVLKQIPENDTVKFLKANTYYQMGMLSDAKKVLSGMITKDAEALKYQIAHDEAITITPSYKFVNNIFIDVSDLDYDEFGLNVTQGTRNNLKLFADCNIYHYDSGKLLCENLGGHNELSNVTTELKLGVIGRPKEKFDFNSNIGAKIFQFNQGYMINTDSWVRRYLNDKSSLKFGIYRDNLEQTYVSAVGTIINGVFTGQVAKNKLYFVYEHSFPNQIYSFADFGVGRMTAKNLSGNNFLEGTFGLGRLMYNNPNNKWVNTVNFDVTSYNIGYAKNNFLVLCGQNSSYGGYYCPNFFTANTAGVKIEGNIKKIKLRYGFKFTGGYQYNPAAGQIKYFSKYLLTYYPYINWEINDHTNLKLYYIQSNLADIIRNIIGFNMVFKLPWKERKKPQT